MMWPEEITYDQIADNCKRMDGTLPDISDGSQIMQVHNDVFKRYRILESRFFFILPWDLMY